MGKNAKDWAPAGPAALARGAQSRAEAERERAESDWLAAIAMPRRARAVEMLRSLAQGGRAERASIALLDRFCWISDASRTPISAHWDAAISREPQKFQRLSAQALEALGAAGVDWASAPASRGPALKKMRAALLAGDNRMFFAMAGHWGGAVSPADARRLTRGLPEEALRQAGRAFPQSFLCGQPKEERQTAPPHPLERFFCDSAVSLQKSEPPSQKALSEWAASEAEALWSAAEARGGVREAWRAAWLRGGHAPGLWAWGRWAFERSRRSAWPAWIGVAMELSGSQEPDARAPAWSDLACAALESGDAAAFKELAGAGMSEKAVDIASRLRAFQAKKPFMVLVDEMGYYFTPSLFSMAQLSRSWSAGLFRGNSGAERMLSLGPLERLNARGNATLKALPAPSWRPRENALVELERLSRQAQQRAPTPSAADRLEILASRPDEWGALAQKALLEALAPASARVSRKAKSL